MKHVCTFRPIVLWPGVPTKVRVAARFKVTIGRTLDLLDRELWHLRAKNIVIEVAARERDIRNDGWLRSDAHPSAPGVILSFESIHGPLRYPCDTYTEWEDNLRAIALALEALRAVNRYGVTKVGEQYTGWKQLPGPLVTLPPMTIEDAAAFMLPQGWHGTQIMAILRTVDDYRQAYRLRALELHPDRNGGDGEGFKKLQQARAVLDKHHNLERTPCTPVEAAG